MARMWTEAEVRYLCKFYYKVPVKALAITLNRSVNSVVGKADRLKDKLDPPATHKPYLSEWLDPAYRRDYHLRHGISEVK